MDMTEMQPLIETGAALAELAVKGTATKIGNKIRASKNEKDIEKIRTMYDEIINEILQEREDAVRIAQTYKSELDRVVISDDDITHLQNTVSNILDIFKSMSPDMDIDSFKAIKDLISVDTLKTMQLLGFNYKAAIGEPLTKLCAEAISNWSKKTTQSTGSKKNR